MNPAAGNPYGIVGDGRVARHMIRYFDLLGLPQVQWSRKSTGPVEEALTRATGVLVLIRDAAIEPFLREHPRLGRGGTVVHFSGSLVTPLACGMHPLMTFGPDLYDRATYESIPFICERGETTFSGVFPSLRNPHHAVEAGLKPLYHSLCVLGGNFTTLLWQKLFSDFESRLKLPREVALPYLRQVVANLSASPGTALTGPLARRDVETIRRDLAALAGDPYEEVYRAFVEAAAPGLLESGQAGRFQDGR